MRFLSVAAGAVSAFFVFYTVRLLVVTHLLQRTRAGGGGAFVGALAFPLLAIAFGWAGRRCWQRASSARGPAA
jgi:hypothetical protein